MKVTIIGTGNVGKALGGTIARSGHDVTLTARNADKTASVAEDIGATAADSIEAAVQHADVVVLAVPYGAVDDVTHELRPVADGKVVVDVTNPLTADYSGLATEGSTSAAEQIAEKLPNARVVKAFNTLFGSVQAEPDALGRPVDALYATSDDVAGQTVAELIDSAGFRPVNAGTLDVASQLEALAFLNIQMQMRFGGDWKSAFVVVGAPEGATAVPTAEAA